MVLALALYANSGLIPPFSDLQASIIFLITLVILLSNFFLQAFIKSFTLLPLLWHPLF